MDSLTGQLLHDDVPDGVPCPSCGFGMWVRISEVVVECAIRCPVCRTQVWMRDDRGNMQNLGSEIESMIEQTMKGLFG
jgi:hypothetical protein